MPIILLSMLFFFTPFWGALYAASMGDRACYVIEESLVARHIEDRNWKQDFVEIQNLLSKAPTTEFQRKGRVIQVVSLSKVEETSAFKSLQYFIKDLKSPTMSRIMRSFWSKFAGFLRANHSYTGVGLLTSRLIWGKDDAKIRFTRFVTAGMGAVGGFAYFAHTDIGKSSFFSFALYLTTGAAAGAYIGPPEIIFRPFDRLAQRKELSSEQDVLEAYFEAAIAHAEANGQTGPVRLLLMRSSEITNQALENAAQIRN